MHRNYLETCIDDERQFKTAKRPQAPGDATVLKRVFHDNFVICRRRSKRIAFLESANSSTSAICNFSIFVTVTQPLFGTLQGPISVKCPVTDSPDQQKAHLQSLGFPLVPLVWVKLFPVGCAQDGLKTRKNAIFIWFCPRYRILEFFTAAPVLTSTLTICHRNCGDPSSLECVASIAKKQSFWFGREPPTL